MVVFPNAKINLGLRILRKRTDGYHDLETVFYPIPLYDALEILPNLPGDDFSFTSSGSVIEGAITDNLCYKAYNLLKKQFPDLPPIRLHLHKNIPSGAGLGGGSADAAFTLRLLNSLFQLNIPVSPLQQYSLQLGSDCPFFLINQPSLATGRGEQLERINLELASCTIVIVNPSIHISTAGAFSKLVPAVPGRSLPEIINGPMSEWKNELINDFEQPVFAQYPEIKIIKEQLYEAGAGYASLSGSGSTVYGLFAKDRSPVFSFPSHYFVRQLTGQLQ